MNQLNGFGIKTTRFENSLMKEELKLFILWQKNNPKINHCYRLFIKLILKQERMHTKMNSITGILALISVFKLVLLL